MTYAAVGGQFLVDTETLQGSLHICVRGGGGGILHQIPLPFEPAWKTNCWSQEAARGGSVGPDGQCKHMQQGQSGLGCCAKGA